MKNNINVIGKKFGMLTILAFSEPYINKTDGFKRTMVLCKCDCGNNSNHLLTAVKSGHTLSCGCLQKHAARKTGKNNIGANNGNFNSDLTIQEREYFLKKRHSHKCNKWKRAVKERDGCCIICGNKNDLHAHHLNSVKYFPEKAYEIENGITLCSTCHKYFHKFCGGQHVPVTDEKFYEFILYHFGEVV